MDEIKKESWNKKRILAALFLVTLLAIGGYFFKTKVFDNKSASPLDILRSVKGTSNVENKNKVPKEDLNINVQKAVQGKIESLKQDVKELNVVEIASSSPQIQKLIKDLNSIKDYPTNQAKEICEKVCSNL